MLMKYFHWTLDDIKKLAKPEDRLAEGRYEANHCLHDGGARRQPALPRRGEVHAHAQRGAEEADLPVHHQLLECEARPDHHGGQRLQY